MHFNRPKMLSPIVHPTKCCNVHETEVFQVPHIHPSHTTVHHHNIFEHIHTCPHSVSHVSDVAHQHFDCCPGPMPGMGMGPGMGAGMYPGLGAGMAPGMGAGMTPSMGAGMAPGMMPTPRPFFRL